MKHTDNIASYEDLGWIISHSDEGFYALIASSKMQESVVSHYRSGPVAVYDYKEHPDDYRFRDVAVFLEEHPQARTVFLLNMQNALMKPEAVRRLNFSRDMLARTNRNFIFCMTEETFDELNRHAFDFFSFLKLKLRFEDELEETEEKPQTFQIPALPKDLSEGVNPDEGYDPAWPRQRQLTFAIAMMNQAEAMNLKNRYADALQFLEKAIEIREEFLGKNHPETASAYFAKGKTLEKKGKYAEALNLVQKAVDIRENILGKDNPYTVETYNAIGIISRDSGKYDDALKWYQKALDIQERVLGTDHPDTAVTYNNMANAYSRLGQYEEALQWHYKALNIKERVFTEHPEIATTYNNIAVVYSHLGKYEDALKWYQKALNIRERVLGTEHPYTATTYNNIALVYYHLGKYEDALKLYKKALDICERVLGFDHPDTSAIYNNIAKVYGKLGQHEEALKYRLKAKNNTALKN